MTKIPATPTIAAVARDLVTSHAAGNITAADTMGTLVAGVLAQLGRDSMAVARRCATGRHHGHPGDDRNNPIARALVKKFGAAYALVTEDGSATLVFIDSAGEEWAFEGLDVPPPVTVFLAEFATGSWGHLVDKTGLRPVVRRYLRSQAGDMDGVVTVQRGTVVSSADRAGVSDPLPTDLVAAIRVAGLDAEEYCSDLGYTSLRLYRGDLCVAMVRGSDFERHPDQSVTYAPRWNVCAGYQFCSRVNVHTWFTDRNEAVEYVLAHLGEVCGSGSNLAGGGA
jgi:hypothetical protein